MYFNKFNNFYMKNINYMSFSLTGFPYKLESNGVTTLKQANKTASSGFRKLSPRMES